MSAASFQGHDKPEPHEMPIRRVVLTTPLHGAGSAKAKVLRFNRKTGKLGTTSWEMDIHGLPGGGDYFPGERGHAKYVSDRNAWEFQGCFCCLVFHDAFERSGDGLAPDGVNRSVGGHDGKRYRFTPGSYVVAGNRLVSLTGGEITFYDDPNNPHLFNVQTSVRLTNPGDQAKIHFDGFYVGCERTSTTEIKYTAVTGSGSRTTDITIAPTDTEFELIAHFYRADRYPGLGTSIVEFEPTCNFAPIDLNDSSFGRYALSASPGVSFGELSLYRAVVDCAVPAFGCQHICFPGAKDSLTVSLSGFADSFIVCANPSGGIIGTLYDECAAEAQEEYESGLELCEELPPGDKELCQCDRFFTYRNAMRTCTEEGFECIRWAPGDDLNGDVELTREPGGGCSDILCHFAGTIPFSGVFQTGDLCNVLLSGELTVTATQAITFLDDDTGELSTRINVAILGLSVTADNEAESVSGGDPSGWETDPITVEEYCEGGNFDLHPTTGTTVYADEVAISVDGGPPRSCGRVEKIEFSLPDPGIEGCEISTEPEIIEECEHAGHDEVELSVVS